VNRFELFQILEGQPSWIGSTQTFDDANAQARLLEYDYLIVDNITGQHVRTNKLLLREFFEASSPFETTVTRNNP
jgi:hypothetical protein